MQFLQPNPDNRSWHCKSSGYETAEVFAATPKAAAECYARNVTADRPLRRKPGRLLVDIVTADGRLITGFNCELDEHENGREWRYVAF